MAKVNAPLLSFNRGVVDPKALARVDVEKLRLAAETQTNWQPTVLGPMMIRPGMEYVASTRSNAVMKPIKFIFSPSDWALLECTDGYMRVRLSNEALVSFSSVSTAVTSGDFSASTGWTLTSGGSSTASITVGGKLNMIGASSSGTAKCDQAVSVTGADINVRHCLKIVVSTGPVYFRAGTSAGDDSYITNTVLETGIHYLSLVPSGTFYVQFESDELPGREVDSIEIFTGTLEMTTTWSASDLSLLRYEQSGDVVFVTCYGQAPRRIERRGTYSWSIVEYKTGDGPFLVFNDDAITITPSGLYGNVTLTASRNLFRSTHVGALWRLFHQGQVVNATLDALNDVSDTIRVTGVGDARIFTYELVFGGLTATITLQRSFESDTTGFTDVTSYTGSVATALADDYDNSIVWYRFKVTAYTSGSGATGALNFPGGGGAGICRLTEFSSATSVTAEVITPFKNVTATADWNEGAWSSYRGFPVAVRLHEGRLCLPMGDNFRASASDNYTSFDFDGEGEAAYIDRTIGYGPVDTINDLISLDRLILFREGSETSVRASAIDEPLTPANTNIKDLSTQGSARLRAVKVDKRAIYVQQSKRRIFDIGWHAEAADYRSRELTRLCPSICTDDVVAIDVQRQPDTRLHFVLDDGTAICCVYDLDDDVVAWWTIETDGEIEDVVIFPGTPEDKVYYIVKRTINGSTVRYLERFARADQCSGLPAARLADAHYIYSGAAVTTITGLSHLNGEDVVVWGYTSGATSGQDLGTFTVSSNQITGLGASVVWACVGLAYTATFKSAKLAYGAEMGTALTQKKQVVDLGLILRNTHYQGLSYGQREDVLDELPLVEDGTVTPADTVWEEFEGGRIKVPGEWDTDARLHLVATAPKPVTVLAAVVGVKTNE